jgi:hypothetical protein
MDTPDREYARAALQRELFDVQFKHPYPYELEFAITTVTNQVVERPRHILAQSAFELLDTLTDQLPKRCERCTTPFPPTRTDQRHCSKKCQQKAYQQSYDKTPHRKEYQRTYRRYKRGSITEAQWIEWKKSRKET